MAVISATAPLPVLRGPRRIRDLARRFYPYVKPQLPAIGVAVLLSIGTIVIAILHMYVMMVAINAMVVGDLDSVATYALLLVGISVAVNLLRFGSTVVLARLNERVTVVLRRDLIHRLHRLELGQHAQQVSGEWISRVLFEADRFREFLSGRLMGLTQSVMLLVAYTSFLLAINVHITLPVVLMIPPITLVAARWVARLQPPWVRQRRDWDRVVGFLTQQLEGLTDIRALGREDAAVAEFDRVTEDYARAHLGLSLKRVGLATFLELCVFLAIGSFIFFGGLEMLDGSSRPGGLIFTGATAVMPMSWMLLGTNKMMATMGMAQGAALSAGALSAFVLFARRLLNPVRELANQLGELADARVSGGRMLEILDLPEERSDGLELPRLRGRIEFDHVTFGYQLGQPVLHDVSLVIEPGQHVAFVGPTGAGKTSLMRLLSRLYEPDQGAIRIDGYDLRTVSAASLRGQLAVVPQETLLFSGTVLENVRFGRPEASDAEVEAALRAIGADGALARLPAGYHTQVGTGGARLSTGQRQLIALGRAVLAEPAIVILDEAISSVDAATQQTVMGAVHQLLEGRTALIVAHRLAHVRWVDLVVVVEGGQLVESGPPEQLLIGGGRFADLWHAQTEPMRAN